MTKPPSVRYDEREMKPLGAMAVSATLAVVLAGPMAAAQPNDACSHDTLMVEGTPVDVTLCAPEPAARKAKGEGGPVSVTVTEVFSAGGNSFTRTSALEFLERPQTSRTIDDVPLQKLGIPKTLHLTIGYRQGSVRLEHAMLIPGAVDLK